MIPISNYIEDSQLATSNLTLPEGPSQFKFSYSLPTDIALPNSFEGDEYGYIRYKMIATLECPPNADYRQELPFRMQQLIDINQPSLSVSTDNIYLFLAVYLNLNVL